MRTTELNLAKNRRSTSDLLALVLNWLDSTTTIEQTWLHTTYRKFFTDLDTQDYWRNSHTRVPPGFRIVDIKSPKEAQINGRTDALTPAPSRRADIQSTRFLMWMVDALELNLFFRRWHYFALNPKNTAFWHTHTDKYCELLLYLLNPITTRASNFLGLLSKVLQ